MVDVTLKSETPAYQLRVIEEKAQLDEKLSKLKTFIDGNPTFNTMEVTDRHLLVQQVHVMEQYSSVLAQRILRFSQR